MKMQPLIQTLTPEGYDVPTGGRTIGYLIEKTESDLQGRGFRIIAALVELPAEMVQKPEEKK